MLHIVSKAPLHTSHLQDCLASLAPGDAVLLLEDGVYGAAVGSTCATDIQKYMERGRRIFVLHEHAAERGLAEQLLSSVESIGYEEFVQLVAEHTHSRSWF